MSIEESQALADIAAERLRQISEEGWSAEHDDKYRHGELGDAASCYAEENPEISLFAPVPLGWPFATRWWKPTDRRRDLVKAGALILAEIERLDRAAARETSGPGKREGEA